MGVWRGGMMGGVGVPIAFEGGLCVGVDLTHTHTHTNAHRHDTGGFGTATLV